MYSLVKTQNYVRCLAHFSFLIVFFLHYIFDVNFVHNFVGYVKEKQMYKYKVLLPFYSENIPIWLIAKILSYVHDFSRD